MLVDPHDKASKEKAAIRFAELISGDDLFEITKKVQRTLSQNSYLHLLLQYLASQVGYPMKYVKREWYKKLINPELFVYKFYDGKLGKMVEEVRSSKDLTQEEMKLSIERLKVWSAIEAEIILPDAEDKDAERQMRKEIERAKQWI